MNENTRPCTPGQRCGNPRKCEFCARARQKKAADKAETMHQNHGQLYFSVITPHHNTGEEIRRLRASLLRKHIATTGIWSIEKGEQFNHLHINIITPAPRAITLPGADIHTERITTTPRAVASYILKKSGQPSHQQYQGRTFGTWGQIGQFLTTKEAAPIVQAAALNDLIATPHTRQPTHYFNTPSTNREQAPTLSKEQYQELARKHLAALYAVVTRQQQTHFGT